MNEVMVDADHEIRECVNLQLPAANRRLMVRTPEDRRHQLALSGLQAFSWCRKRNFDLV